MKVYILLDRSGSMSTRWAEAVSSINSYVADLAKAEETAKAEVTLACFDHQGGLSFDVMRLKMPADSWNAVAPKEVEPRGTTPLFDAIGMIVTMAKADASERAMIVVMTDGHENSSAELSKEAAKAALDSCRSRGWGVIFLGANFDAFGQAASLGNAAEATLNMADGSYAPAAMALSNVTRSYASSGTLRSFTEDERAKAVGKN